MRIGTWRYSSTKARGCQPPCESGLFALQRHLADNVYRARTKVLGATRGVAGDKRGGKK